MTTPLVRRVQAAIERADAEFRSDPAIPHYTRHLAQAAIAACRAAELRNALVGTLAAFANLPVLVYTAGTLDALDAARQELAETERGV